MKIVVIDGQGGKMGQLLVEQIKQRLPAQSVIAIGTNTLATAAMLRAGADAGATGENPVIVNCRDADYIVGPIGILAADALLGEVTPAMAHAVSSSRARKLLVPLNRCNLYVTGVQDMPAAEYIRLTAERLAQSVQRGEK